MSTDAHIIPEPASRGMQNPPLERLGRTINSRRSRKLQEKDWNTSARCGRAIDTMLQLRHAGAPKTERDTKLPSAPGSVMFVSPSLDDPSPSVNTHDKFVATVTGVAGTKSCPESPVSLRLSLPEGALQMSPATCALEMHVRSTTIAAISAVRDLIVKLSRRFAQQSIVSSPHKCLAACLHRVGMRMLTCLGLLSLSLWKCGVPCVVARCQHAQRHVPHHYHSRPITDALTGTQPPILQKIALT